MRLGFKALQRLTAPDSEVDTTSKPQEIKFDLISPSLTKRDFGRGTAVRNAVAEFALMLSDCLSPLAQSLSAGGAYAKPPVL